MVQAFCRRLQSPKEYHHKTDWLFLTTRLRLALVFLRRSELKVRRK
jgi:hypothetical protein